MNLARRRELSRKSIGEFALPPRVNLAVVSVVDFKPVITLESSRRLERLRRTGNCKRRP
jgi:hypothetical protein